jgi:TatD DNase family protein
VIQPVWVDTHTHLDDEMFDSDRDEVIRAAEELGVLRMVNIGYEPTRWVSTVALADRYPCIAVVLGLHPGSTDAWSPATIDQLHDLVRRHRPLAVGEIGIDLYWRQDDVDRQMESFRAQIELAMAEQLPVVIHQRAAADPVADILGEAPMDLRVVLHSFDGDNRLARIARERNWLIGVGGLSTRRQNEDLRATLRTFPLDQIVLETDSPYLVPSGVKSRRNTPSSIPLIGARLAGLRGIAIEEVAATTTRNAGAFFGLPVESAAA